MRDAVPIGSGPDTSAASVLAWPVLGLAAARGVSPGRLVRAAELDADALADATGRVPLKAVQRLWKLAAEQLQAPHLGLLSLVELGAGGPGSWPDPVALYERLFIHSATLGEGVDRVARYTRILRDGFQAYIYDRDGRASLRFDFDVRDPAPLIQLHVGMVVLMKRRALPEVPCVNEVWLREPTPDQVDPYHDFFGVPVRFGAPYDGVLSSRPYWEEPLPSADEARCNQAQWRADVLLAKLPDPERISDRVGIAVHAALPGGDIRVDAVARRLGLSPRTLHRRLAAEGESFQQLLDEARRQRAMRELASSALPIRDVGARVGFRNVSAFHRAFKSWTGVTPVEFRKRHSPRGGRQS